MLNPTKFLCPVCKFHCSLKKFNDLSFAVKHISGHHIKGNETAEILVLRYNFLKENEWADRIVGDLDDVTYGEEKLSLAGRSLFLPDGSKPFIGRTMLMDDGICEKLLMGDQEALNNLPTLRVSVSRSATFTSSQVTFQSAARTEKTSAETTPTPSSTQTVTTEHQTPSTSGLDSQKQIPRSQKTVYEDDSEDDSLDNNIAKEDGSENTEVMVDFYLQNSSVPPKQ